MGNKVMVSLRLPYELLKKLDSLAEKENRSRTNYIETVLINHVEKKK